MKICRIANTLQTTESEWPSMVLQHIADELRHIRSVLAIASRRRRPDALLVRALTRRRDELLRRMQVLAHGARHARAYGDMLQTYH